MLKKRFEKALFLVLGVFLIVGSLGIVSAGDDSFEVSSLLLKISVNEGKVIEKSFTIESNDGGEFSVNAIGLDGAELSEGNFVLEIGESKNVILSLDSYGVDKGIYAGSIKISNAKKEIYLPVIIEIESRDVFFDINLDISPTYSEVAPGEKLIAQLKVLDLISVGTNEELGTKSVDLKYFILDIKGNILVSDEESIVVDRQVQITKTVSLPEGVEEGDYVFAVSANFGSSVGTSSYLFSVREESFDFEGDLNINFIAILVVIVIIFAGLFFLVIYFMRGRGRLVIELGRHHARERKEQRKVLYRQAKVAQKKGVPRREIQKAIKKAVKKLKVKQKTRVKHIKTLGKNKKGTGEMSKALNAWKSAGYSTYGLEYKTKNMGVADMKKAMSKWGKKYKKKK